MQSELEPETRPRQSQGTVATWSPPMFEPRPWRVTLGQALTRVNWQLSADFDFSVYRVLFSASRLKQPHSGALAWSLLTLAFNPSPRPTSTVYRQSGSIRGLINLVLSRSSSRCPPQASIWCYYLVDEQDTQGTAYFLAIHTTNLQRHAFGVVYHATGYRTRRDTFTNQTHPNPRKAHHIERITCLLLLPPLIRKPHYSAKESRDT